MFRESVDDVFTFDYEGKPDFLIIEIDIDDPLDQWAASLPVRSAVVTRHRNRTTMQSGQANLEVPGE